MESTRNHASLDRAELLRILTKLTDAEIFEQFIHKNYVGAKRFSLEGAESMIPLIDLLVEAAGAHGIEELVIGMAHRGRLNVLVNVMGKNVREIFAAFDDKQPERFLGGGRREVPPRLLERRRHRRGRAMHLSMAFNPSHLEFVNPVVEGRVRAKIDRRKRKSTMPLLVHGDAVVHGPGRRGRDAQPRRSSRGTRRAAPSTSSSTTRSASRPTPSDSRSTRYCTDIARELRVPVFHVNGEDPEAVIQVTRLAVEFRQRFKQDVVIDMYCYRKYGHNEGDEPRFTQPLMYALIDKKPARARGLRGAPGRGGAHHARGGRRDRRLAARHARGGARGRARGRLPPDARRPWAACGRRTAAGPDAGRPRGADDVPEGAPARGARSS